jgi:hypothetical protein
MHARQSGNIAKVRRSYTNCSGGRPAIAWAFPGNRLLKKVTIPFVQYIVAMFLFLASTA